jgi:hypothetical protein
VRLRLTLLLTTALVSSSACQRPELVAGVNDSTFVRVMAALRRLPIGASIDTVARARLRDSILRANGLTVAQLESAAASLSDNPTRASDVWKAIERRAADTTPPKPLAPAARVIPPPKGSVQK